MIPEQREAIAVSRLLRPRSVAIVGVSSDPNSFGATVLTSLQNYDYAGEIHIVSRGRTEVFGRPSVPSIDDLPSEIDAAVLCVPRDAALDSLAACGRRGVRAAIVFASGFAETGSDGKEQQERLAKVARDNRIAMLGPNCLGFTNFLDGVPLRMGLAVRPPQQEAAVALIAQSGAMMSAIRDAMWAHGIGLTHAISTGNEAVLGVEDFVADLIDDAATRIIVLFVEHIRRPLLFLDLVARSRTQGKPIVLFHSGRSSAAREAATTHTGALCGDYATMKTLVEHHAVVLVESFDELIDVTAILTRITEPPTQGVGVVTNSGAFRGIAFDVCEAAGLDVPGLSIEASTQLREMLPSFVPAENPLDLATQLMRDPQLLGSTTEVLLRDPAIGSVVVAVVPGTGTQAVEKALAADPVLRKAAKPAIFSVIGGDAPLPDEFLKVFKEGKTTLFRSPERALRAMARVTAYGRSMQANRVRRPATELTPIKLPDRGVIPEYRSKQFLAKSGIRTPDGRLAKNVEDACTCAFEIGYPVVLKAQSSALAHKSDVGGVALDISDEAALRAAWDRLHLSVAGVHPDLVLDGVLVEGMARRGVEMVVGARRDAEWGPVLVVGLGGIWVEALGDVCLIPASASGDEIFAAIKRTRAAKLLGGLRGQPPADIDAVVHVVGTVAAMMRAMPELKEIDINPLVVYPAGQGAVALDALMVVSGPMA
jgi:acyl-CoA synthetase (NDP forming)